MSAVTMPPAEKKAKQKGPRFYRRDLLQAKFRRWFFRYFQNWYRENQHRFLMPLYLCRNQDRNLVLGIGDIPCQKMHICIIYSSPSFQDGSLNFYWNGENIDHIWWMDTCPQRSSMGYFCKACHDYGKDLLFFPSREALWEDHIFERMLKGVNEEIAGADRIELRAEEDGSSYAKFVKSGQTDGSYCDIPIVDIIEITRQAN